MLNFAVSLLHERKLLFWNNWLKKLQNDKEIAQSRKMIPKRKKSFLEREISFPQIIPLQARYPVIKTLKKIFSTKGSTFFYLKLRRRSKQCAIFQKLLNLRIFERYASCSFHNHAGNFSLENKKNFAQNNEKNRRVTFFWKKFFFSLLLETFLQFCQPWE